MPENVLYTQCPKFSQWPIEWCFTLQFSVLKMKMLWDTMNITEDLSYIIYREVDWPPWIIFFNHSMFHYHSNIYKLETGQSPQGTLENRLVPVPGSRCIVPQILGIPWVAKTLYMLMDSFWLEARQLQHGSWSAEVQDGTRVLGFSHPLTSWKGRTVVLDHVWLCYVAHQAPLSMKFPRQEYWSRFDPWGWEDPLE